MTNWAEDGRDEEVYEEARAQALVSRKPIARRQELIDLLEEAEGAVWISDDHRVALEIAIIASIEAALEVTLHGDEEPDDDD